MKKQVILFVILVVVICGFSGLFFYRANRTNMEFAKEAQIHFRYGDKNISQILTAHETEEVKSIFTNKKMYRDNPSCGFSTDVSIRFNKAQTFCIACDTCPVIYWREKNRYFSITEAEKEQLYQLLESYGCSFPCL